MSEQEEMREQTRGNQMNSKDETDQNWELECDCEICTDPRRGVCADGFAEFVELLNS